MDDGPSSPTSIDPTSGSRTTRPVPTERKPAMPSRPDGNMERRQRRAAPDLRHGALAHVTIGQRLASARHSNRVLTLHPLLCPPSTPPLCNNNHRPTQPNPTLPYPSAAHRNFFSLYSTLPLHFARAYARRRAYACTYALLARTHHSSSSSSSLLREAHERAGTKNERGTSERAGGRRGGRRGHKGR